MADVKFCGLTRAEDARLGASVGAAYLGAIFAGGPRQRNAAEARALFDAAAPGGNARRVGVFGTQAVPDIAAIAREAGLDVVQLHAGADAELVRELRRHFGGEVWRVLRVRGRARAAELRTAAAGVDALVVDSLTEGALGGTGVPLDWEALAEALDRAGRPARLVLAGGLRPDNVGRAIAVVSPDVVDVSSGVESAPGLKDHEMMRAFAVAAARGGQ